MNNPTVAFHTLGCKLNFAETSTIARQLKDHGYSKVEFEHAADVYVINTCSVTENADRECRMIVRRALAQNPAAFVIVIGCYAQLKPEVIASMDGVDLVLGATEKFNIIRYLDHINKKQIAEVHSCEVESADFFVSSYSLGDRTRAFLKVQDGCDYSCTYCTIPLARGSSRSDSVSNVVKQAEKIASTGIREIVLTGVNIGDFEIQKNKEGKETFFDLVRELDQVNGIERFRISSIEPNLLSDEIIEFVSASKKFVPHFHIPLQSGSDKILKLMRRRYLREVFLNRVEKIKSLMPHACIGADVITGFPGETENDFLETYQFIQSLDVSYLHVFTYSERDNTEALNIREVVPVNERKKRNKMLRILSQKKINHFYQQHFGTKKTVLFESEEKEGMIHGYTENYIRIKFPFDASLANQLQQVKLVKIDDDGNMICELADSMSFAH
ncbi:MAG: tRNA (N(6)-L-threonylcarbamoyladenosine(37)-C(2))-methylthiotransferase MtaB [Bacteroidetes bacterium]|nr:tRNA (N(6)-L-threonylcarbamoyladenosine(37)-C(2))-methylthiotransferase MtaB [Bacteroidota bacterium]